MLVMVNFMNTSEYSTACNMFPEGTALFEAYRELGNTSVGWDTDYNEVVYYVNAEGVMTYTDGGQSIHS